MAIEEQDSSQNDSFDSRINLDNLNSITGGKPEKIQRYIDIFLKNIPKDLEQMIRDRDQTIATLKFMHPISPLIIKREDNE